jgi:hypothetical protein
MDTKQLQIEQVNQLIQAVEERIVALTLDLAATPVFDVYQMPAGYRDWKFVSVAHEEGNLNDLRAVLGNDIAIKAYREGKLPFPGGQLLPGSLGSTCLLMRTTKCLAVNSRSSRETPPTCSSWLRIQRNM